MKRFILIIGVLLITVLGTCQTRNATVTNNATGKTTKCHIEKNASNTIHFSEGTVFKYFTVSIAIGSEKCDDFIVITKKKHPNNPESQFVIYDERSFLKELSKLRDDTEGIINFTISDGDRIFTIKFANFDEAIQLDNTVRDFYKRKKTK